MGSVSRWTGFEANILRSAMRLSLRSYAEYLGVSFGTVATWNRRGATVQPTPDMQAVLDTALSKAPHEVRQRFEAMSDESDAERPTPGPSHGPLHAALADHSSVGASDVLLTIRIDGQMVTLPLDSVAAAARASAAGLRSGARQAIAADAPDRLVPVSTQGDERAYELFVRGYGLLGSNDRRQIERAQNLLQQAVDRDPSSARALAARGYASWRQYFAGWSGRSQALTDALGDVEAALGFDPGSVAAHLTFVRACWDLGWHERAMEAGRSIYQRNPDSLDATVAFARSLNNAGLAQCALPLLDQVLTMDPRHPAAVKLRVWCRLMIGDHAGALAAAHDHLEHTPSDANTRWAVALAAANLDDPGQSPIKIAEQGLLADPGDVTLWVLLGYLHRWVGDEDAAQQAWRQGLDQVPTAANHRTAVWRANLLAGVGDLRGAERAVRDLVTSAPRSGYLRYRLVHVLAEAGQDVRAVQALAQAVDQGFLSGQLLRHELPLGLSRLRSMAAFGQAVADLDREVARCHRTYAADLPMVAVVSNLIR
jgi:tetratricopeptide (TPR) repeat protein